MEQVIEHRDIDREQAHKLVEQHDQWRQSYLHNFHDADWDDPLLYDLTINTGNLTPEAAVELLCNHAVNAS